MPLFLSTTKIDRLYKSSILINESYVFLKKKKKSIPYKSHLEISPHCFESINNLVFFGQFRVCLLT
jgi:hypothetical protein